MRLMVRSFLFFICFAVFTSLFAVFLLHLDVNKRAYNHVPGECGIIPNLPGILSLATTTGGRLYLTVNSRENTIDTTHLFTFYSDNRTAREIETTGKMKKMNFRPGPISATSNPEIPLMFVFNDRMKNVEVFETNEQSDSWKFLRTWKHQRFERLHDLAASTENTIYFVTSSFLGEAFNLFERIIPVPSGQVFFADKKNIKMKQLMFVSTPTGIVMDELKKTLFVTSFTRNSIYALKLKTDQEVEKITEHKIGCSPTSIWKDFDGSFVITCQQVRFRHLLHLFGTLQTSPSLVLRVVIPVDNDKEVTITQLYSNDGATISHATYAVRAGRSLLISEGEKILNCHL